MSDFRWRISDTVELVHDASSNTLTIYGWGIGESVCLDKKEAFGLLAALAEWAANEG